ncbi:hypothetical protein QYE76_008818 [Lolium multiflorum]|uniref:Integrase catalytic domain-containing protein n=1 Tax=Lolium multiflorum TaxID=4521 RepID=A0AAD8TQT5_LOLMU|nr:hypothetical protein QYE76_008818 [Lolium multiflorum]
MDGGKQIETGLGDFVPHPPARLDAYAYLEEPMEMKFGSFYFCVGREGSRRLAAPICSGPLAGGSDYSGSSSSTKSSGKTSSTSSVTPTVGGDLANLFGGMSFGSFTDSDLDSDLESIDSFNFIDKSTFIREVFADRYDGVTDPEDDYSRSTYHQVHVIDHPQQVPRPGQSALILPAVIAGFDVSRGLSLIDDLKETFDNLDKFRLKLNPTKCSFGVPAGELLGYLVSARGIEAIPEKIQAIVTMRKPTKLKEIQQLTGRVAALSRFVARLGEKALPFYALIKQGEKFEWNEEADRAFEHLKRTISTPPILVAPKEKEPLLLYIADTPQVVSTVLVVEREEEDAASVVSFVKGIVFRFGVPHSIVTDNGSNFTSKEFKAYCGERQETPFFLVHGAEAVLPIEIEHNSPRVVEYDEETSRKALEDDVDALDEARDEVLSRVTKYQQDLKNYHSRRLRPRSFQVGDLVLRLTQDSHEKFESPWVRPYIVTEVIAGGAYRIKDKKTGVAEPNPWNVAQLRRFYA